MPGSGEPIAQQSALQPLLRGLELDAECLAGLLPGLKVAVDALSSVPDMSTEGRQRVLAQYRDNLERLAAIRSDRVRNPDIEQVSIKRPIFILGLPRCGTSLLHALMGADPAVRTPLMWEVAAPSPPPQAASFDTDPRAQTFDDYVEEAFAGKWANVRKAHPIGARIPQECGMILETAFCSANPVMMFRLPALYAWYREADTRFGYAMHRQWLQHLGWRHPKDQWVLKVQEHMYHIPELLSVYPDAVFIQLHRDPRTVMASISELIRTIRSVAFEWQDPVALGAEMLHLWHDGQVKMMNWRESHPAAPVLDLSFSGLMGDPIATVSEIYKHYEMPFTSSAEQNMRQWLADNPADKHGRHRYSLEDFGLTEEQIAEVYADYMERYGGYF